MQSKSKPVYLNLFTLGPKMSVTAKVSIFHRLSGILLFISIPFILYLLHKSLTETSFYTAFYGVMSCVVMKLIYLLLIWAFIYHISAGVRFLFLDISRGVEVKKAKLTARIVLIVSTILTIALGILILW